MMPCDEPAQFADNLVLHEASRIFTDQAPPYPLIPPFRVEMGSHRLQYHPGNGTLVVSFENADRPDEEPYDSRPAWGEKFYISAGYSLLGVFARKSDWYRNAKLIKALETLRDKGFFARFDRIVMVGGSMGGFAAASFAPLVPGCTVVSFSPQISLSAALAPWEKRFREGAREDWSLPYSDAGQGAKSASVCYVVYDNLLRVDLYHARAFGFDPHMLHLIIPGSGHGVATSLQKMGMLKRLCLDLIENRLDVPEFYRQVRKRRDLPRTYQILASHALSRKRFGMAKRINDMARQKFQALDFPQIEPMRSAPTVRTTKNGSKMRKPLYLHIGTHRTATTNIQATMYRNWHNLLDLGYLYPLGVERHIGVINAIFRGDRKASDVAEDLLKRSEAQKKHVHSLIMSDEDISMRRDLSPLKALGDVFDVRVVMAMRRQDLWLESWWAQNVKGQWDRDLHSIRWTDFIEKRQQFHWIDYKRYINHIEAVFGPDTVIPFVFERSQMPKGPVAEFARVVGIPNIEHFEPAGGKNISLTPEMSEFVRYLPFIEAKMGYRLALIEVAEEVDRKIRDEGRSTLILPHDLRREIMAGYAEGNLALAQRYFGRDELFLEPLPSPGQEIVSPALPQDTEVLMSRLVGPFVQALINRFDQN